MNPGTVLFIILGLIGLLIYISKALKPSSLENFAVIDETSISNKGKEGLDRLQAGNLNLESIISAISTPAVSISNSTGFGAESLPSVSDFAKFNNPVSAPKGIYTNVQFDKANLAPVQPVQPLQPVQPVVQLQQQQAVLNKAMALPPLTPASLINMQQAATSDNGSKVEIKEPMTVSDTQGTLLTKSTLPFEKQKSDQIEKQKERKKERQEKPKKRKTKIVYIKNECPKLPDMSLYIRKDSIPCWGCNLK
jgi:hypothetical protein